MAVTRLAAQLDSIRHHPVVLEQQAQRAADLRLRIAGWVTANRLLSG